MENNSHKLTQKGIDKLKAELEKLKTVERDRVLEALREARSQGDLSENADYDTARADQARIENRIKEIENILKHAELITDDRSNNRVSIGKTVTLKINAQEPEDYNIVGSLEADPFDKKISNESPIGKAVIGAKKGDKVRAKTAVNKETEIEILDVK